MLEKAAAGVVVAGLMFYAMFALADFGSGVWTAILRGGKGRDRERESLLHAMGPVWETNHVWLILVVVALFTAFPGGFANLFVALMVPLAIALVGIVFRGGGFAFNRFGRGSAGETPVWAATFSIASVLTPFIFGVALAATSTGRIQVEDGEVTSNLFKPWLHVFPILFGITTVTICAFLTSSFMTTRTTGDLREGFRSKALASGVVLGALAVLTLGVSYWDARPFWDQWLRATPLAMTCVTAVVGLAALAVLARRLWALAPFAAAATAGMLVIAWSTIQYPWLLMNQVSIFDVAAPHTTLQYFLFALPVGALILVPSLALLFWAFVGEQADEEPQEAI